MASPARPAQQDASEPVGRAEVLAAAAGDVRGVEALPWAEILHATPLALAINDPSGERIVYATPAYARLHGYGDHELIGHPVAEMYAPGARDALEARVRRAGLERAATFRSVHLRKDGSTFPARVDARAAADAEGRVRYWIVTVEDLTEAEAVAEARARLAAIVASSEDAIVGQSADGTVTSWNAAAERLFGYPAAEIEGRPVLALIPPELHAEEAGLQARLARGERVAPFETERLRKDGARIRVSLSVSAVRDAEGRVTGAAKILRDVTARREEEAAERFLADASARLADSLDAAATLRELAGLAIETMADGCLVTLRDEAAEARGDYPFVQVEATSRVPGRAELVREAERRFPLSPDAEAGYPRVIRTGRSELVPAEAFEASVLPAIAASPEHLALLRRLDMHAGMVVPLTARGRTLGAITLVRHGPGRRPPFTPRDLRLAEELGRRAGVALDNARLFAEARAAAERTARLQAITAGLARAVTPEEVAATVVREGIAAFQAGNGVVCLASGDGRWLEIVHAVGLSEWTAREFQRVPLDGPFPIAEAARSGEPLFFESRDAIQGRYPGLREANRHALAESWIALPLVSTAGPVLGGLSFGFQGPRAFTGEDRALGLALARQCALALERARAYQAERAARAEAERAADQTARLQAVTAALAATVTTDDVAAAMLDHGLAAVGATAGVVCRLNDDASEIDRIWTLGYPQEGLEGFRRIALVEALPPRDVVRTRAPVFVSSPEEWLARYLPPGPGMEIAPAAAGLPLLVGERLVGVMVLRFPAPRPFAADERTQILSVASQCAQALERARLNEAEREARTAAEEANRAKSEFLATMSHELRTPLNAIAGHVQLVEMGLHGPVTQAQRDALARVTAAQQRLLGIINDLLNFARVQSGRVEYALAAVPVGELAAEVAALLEPQLAERALSLRVRLPEDAGAPPLPVWADREKLAQVLLNLLSNAVKHTPPGGRITLELAPDAADPGRALLRVSDTGVGIPADKLESIFEPFVQLGRSLTWTGEGTGLGLAISRDLARGMGGDLTAESTPGAGSTFTLALRRA